MSRSVRRRAWRGVGGAASQRFEKRHATRRLRGAVHEALHRGTDPLPVRFELSLVVGQGQPDPGRAGRSVDAAEVTGTAPDDLRRRRRTLLAMLAAARLEYSGPPPELVRLLRGWFDSWPGIGGVALGMARRSYDLEGGCVD